MFCNSAHALHLQSLTVCAAINKSGCFISNMLMSLVLENTEACFPKLDASTVWAESNILSETAYALLKTTLAVSKIHCLSFHQQTSDPLLPDHLPLTHRQHVSWSTKREVSQFHWTIRHAFALYSPRFATVIGLIAKEVLSFGFSMHVKIVNAMHYHLARIPRKACM